MNNVVVSVSKERYHYVMHDMRDPKTGEPLRDYQKEGVEYLIRHPRMILGDDKGIGKSVQLLAVLYMLGATDVIWNCGQSALPRCAREIKKWFPDWDVKVLVIEGNPAKREKLWKAKADIKVCTYQTYYGDVEKGWAPLSMKFFVGDEIHRARNQKTKIFKSLCKVKSEYFYGLTGSPVKKGSQDLWALMYLCNPQMFQSYWRWVHTFCIVEETMFGKEIVGMQNAERMHKLIAPHYLRRSKKDPLIAAQMPPKTRNWIDVEMPSNVAKLYHEMAKDMIINLPEGKHYTARTVLDMTMRLRQLLACPKLIDPSLPIGNGIDAILEFIDDNEMDKAVIFTLFPGCFPFIQPYVESKGFKTAILKGGLNSKEIDRISEDWFSEPGKRIILNSIQFAESYDLIQADTCFFLGASYDLEENAQAEDRLHRLSSPSPVDCRYVRFKNTCDDRVFDILDTKGVNITHSLRGADAARALLQGAARDMIVD